MNVFFVISKILDFFLMPTTWILVLLLAGLLIRKSKLAKRFLWASFFTFIFFSNSFIVDLFIRIWEIPPVHKSEIKNQYDFAIVLGGGMVTDNNTLQRPIFQHNTDRILQAIDLYYEGSVDKIIISGGAGQLVFKNMLEADILKEFWVKNGVLEEDIISENRSNNTYQNALFCKEIIEKDNPKARIILLTSALHMRRSKAIFKKQNISVEIYPTNPLVGEWRYNFSYLFMPNVEALRRWNMVIHETFGYFVYKIMGYL